MTETMKTKLVVPAGVGEFGIMRQLSKRIYNNRAILPTPRRVSKAWKNIVGYPQQIEQIGYTLSQFREFHLNWLTPMMAQPDNGCDCKMNGFATSIGAIAFSIIDIFDFYVNDPVLIERLFPGQNRDRFNSTRDNSKVARECIHEKSSKVINHFDVYETDYFALGIERLAEGRVTPIACSMVGWDAFKLARYNAWYTDERNEFSAFEPGLISAYQRFALLTLKYGLKHMPMDSPYRMISFTKICRELVNDYGMDDGMFLALVIHNFYNRDREDSGITEKDAKDILNDDDFVMELIRDKSKFYSHDEIPFTVRRQAVEQDIDNELIGSMFA